MSRLVPFAMLLFFLPVSGSAQSTFELTDSVFKLNSFTRDIVVTFDYDKATIRPESFPQLDSLATFIIKNPRLIIEVSNHRDSRSNAEEYGRNLTQDRADAVADYLISKGVPAPQLIAKGYGHTKPLIPDEKIKQLKSKDEIEKAHAQNRRTEFTIIGFVSTE